MNYGVLVRAAAFGEDFIPRNFVGRENQVREISDALAPVREGRPAKNLHVFGSPGSGKTLTVRRLLHDSFAKNHVYVNCWDRRTSHKIMEEALLQRGQIVHGRESTSDLMKMFESSAKKPLIICLDEFDRLRDCDILYWLSRKNCTLVLVSSRPDALAGMDERIVSGLHAAEVEFGPYTESEIVEILRERCEDSLNPSSYNDETLSCIAGQCSGDARSAIQILKNSAIDAESRSDKMISVEDIMSAAKSTKKQRASYLVAKLNRHQRLLYEILRGRKAVPSGKLFSEFCMRIDETVTDRSYRNYMHDLVEAGLVREISSGRWKKYEIIF